MLIDKNAVTMQDLDDGAVAAMEYGRCPAGDRRFCFAVAVETGDVIRRCEHFDQGNPADDEPQCTYGIDSRPLP